MSTLKNIAKRSTAKTGNKGQGFPGPLTNTADRAKKAGGKPIPAGGAGKKGAMFGKTTMNGPLKNKKPTGKTI